MTRSPLLGLLFVVACGAERIPPPAAVVDAGSLADAGDVADAGTIADAGSPEDAGTSADAGTEPDAGTPFDAGTPGTPILAAESIWTYAHFPDAHCGNGTETGIGVNLKPGAKTFVLFLQGGGACWEFGACYILKTASHVEDTVGAAVVLAEAVKPELNALFNRLDPTNPLKDAHYAYVPYCTGDLHYGTHIQRYEAFGQIRDLHHVGALNLDAYLKRLVPTMAGVDRVIVAGLSAGGYGALLNWWRVKRAFGPGVRVDVLDDSGLPVAMAWDRYGTAMAAWKPEWPEGCADCATGGYPKLLPHYATTMLAPQRFGLFGYRQDAVIAGYFGITGADIQNGLDALKSSASANQRFFLKDGADHVFAGRANQVTSTGVKAIDWLHDFVNDAPGWDHAGP